MSARLSFENPTRKLNFSNFFPFSAFFQCYVCHASVSVEIDRGRISEPALCRNCNTNHSMVLIHNRSQYTDKQITKLQESPGDYIGNNFSRILAVGQKIYHRAGHRLMTGQSIIFQFVFKLKIYKSVFSILKEFEEIVR